LLLLVEDSDGLPMSCLPMARGSYCVFLMSLLSLLAWPAAAASDIGKAELGNWIELLDIPQADPSLKGQINDGISHLLSDYQIRHMDGGWEVFDRYAYQVVDRTGLDRGATIAVEFDPATSTIAMNRINVIRDGVVTDRLADASFEIVRREREAERGVFDGWLTAYVNISDVRVGDIIDYGRTTMRTPVVGADLFYHRFYVESDSPVARIRHKIVWPEDRPLLFANDRTDLVPRLETRGGSTTYLWDIANPVLIRPEQDLPPDYAASSSVEVSSTSDWQDVVDVVLPHYAPHEPLPAGWVTNLDAISAAFDRPEDRMIETMRLVQDSLRYVSLSMGSGSYIPRRPSVVADSGFGDCKDKALLLATALTHLGIEAVVALTDIDEGVALAKGLPALRRFDHTIVRAVIDENTYWLDATNFLMGGRAENLAVPDFGYALPLVASHAKLQKIWRRALLQPTMEIQERFEFPRAGGPLKVTVITTYRDQDADRMRFRLANSLGKVADDYLRYYNRQYPGLESAAPLRTSDDRDANIVVVEEAYELSGTALAADGLLNEFPLQADLGIDALPQPSAVGRKAPVWIGKPQLVRHKVIVTNLKAKFRGPPDADREIFGAFGMLVTDWKSTDTEFEIGWAFGTFADQLPSSALAAYLKTLDRMLENDGFFYNFGYNGNAGRSHSTPPRP
jgi:transglutaminase-like putative cysteine protease